MREPVTTFSEQEEALLKRSFAEISADPRKASQIFYEHLFRNAPDAQDLFLNDMARQGDKLIATLGTVILQIGNLANLKPTIEELGLRHVAYGVQPEHYPATGAALYKMLEDTLQDGLTAETRAAWEKAYAAISHVMVTAVENRKSAKPLSAWADEDDDDAGL